jgi:hypothetical protein
MEAQIGIRAIGDAAEYGHLRARYAGRLDARALRGAVAPARAGAEPGAEDLARWYVPFLAATLLAMLAVDALAIWALL